MNQKDYTDEQESLRRERFLGITDAESRLNINILKLENDLKEDIQKLDKNLNEKIQKVDDSHRLLVSRLWWIAGIGFSGIVAIAVALITK